MLSDEPGSAQRPISKLTMTQPPKSLFVATTSTASYHSLPVRLRVATTSLIARTHPIVHQDEQYCNCTSLRAALGDAIWSCAMLAATLLRTHVATAQRLRHRHQPLRCCTAAMPHLRKTNPSAIARETRATDSRCNMQHTLTQRRNPTYVQNAHALPSADNLKP